MVVQQKKKKKRKKKRENVGTYYIYCNFLFLAKPWDVSHVVFNFLEFFSACKAAGNKAFSQQWESQHESRTQISERLQQMSTKKNDFVEQSQDRHHLQKQNSW